MFIKGQKWDPKTKRKKKKIKSLTTKSWIIKMWYTYLGKCSSEIKTLDRLDHLARLGEVGEIAEQLEEGNCI